MSMWDQFTKEELHLISIKNLANPLGLNRNAWNFSRGAKTIREYIKDGNVFIDVVYTYVMSNSDREVEDYEEWITFYNEDGSVFYKIEVPSSFNIKNKKEINRAIRQGRIDYLEAGAEKLMEGADKLEIMASVSSEPEKSYYLNLASQYKQLSQSMDIIFSHYKAQTDSYVKSRRTMMEFEDAVNNETDQSILNLLSLTVRQPDALFPNGLTAKQSIIHQLTGVKP